MKKNDCLICGSPLEYFDKDTNFNCIVCGKEFNSNVCCVNKHYVCDSCHSKEAFQLTEDFCMQSDSTNPITIANSLMRFSAYKMHGPEHHYLVPASLITAYANSLKRLEKKEWLQSARSRATKVPGGFCGSHGTCGAAMGCGIFFSVVTATTPLSKETWKLSNLLTAEVLIKIADSGGPRCCKRDSYIAISTSIDFIERHMDVSLEKEAKIKCTYSKLNNECLLHQCPFH